VSQEFIDKEYLRNFELVGIDISYKIREMTISIYLRQSKYPTQIVETSVGTIVFRGETFISISISKD